MEITIKSDGRKVSVEVTAEVGEFWEQSRRKARNLQQEQKRHWDGRGYDEYIAATEYENQVKTLLNKQRDLERRARKHRLIQRGAIFEGVFPCFKTIEDNEAVQAFLIALLDLDVPVLMTNFPSVLARLAGTFGEARTEFLNSLGDYDLLIIDDLGVERNTEYALEQMFSIIDSRYRSGKPLIVTTNLKLDELKNPPDLAHARIYDRILKRCAPILFAGKNFREDNAASTKAAARTIVTY